MRRLLRYAALAATATAAFAAAAALGLLSSRDALAVLLLVLGGLGLLLVVGGASAAAAAHAPSPFEEALRPPPSHRQRPADLAHLELDLALAAQNRGHLRSRIVPLVRDAADARAIARADALPPGVRAFLERPDAATLDGLRAALDALDAT